MGASNMNILSVDITKTKQEIQNLQNQISAQQANYLKTQPLQPPMPGGPSGMGSNPGGGGNSGSGGITDMLGGLGLGNSSISSPMVPGGGGVGPPPLPPPLPLPAPPLTTPLLPVLPVPSGAAAAVCPV